MGTLMDLVAGETREILLAIALDDWESLADRSRFDAHLALGGGLDLAWLDRFSRALREVTGRPEPLDFSAACEPLSGPTGGEIGERTVERVETS